MAPPRRYRALAPWLRTTFGRPVRRVALDAGSSCPNRDGSRGRGGCVYCDVEGSGTGELRSGVELAEQLARGIERVRRGAPTAGVIAYFQSYSNTYLDAGRFEEMLAVLESGLADPVVCVSVATRPDTLPDWALERLARLARRVPVWVELGLEVADDRRLVELNRLHTVADFRSAVERVHAAGLAAIGHAILGLPGDGREGARRTASVLRETGVEGVKVHHMMVLERTVLAHWWRAGRAPALDLETYVAWLADFVEQLSSEQVLHRLCGDAPEGELLAPRWNVHKNRVQELLEAELARRGTEQGARAAYPVAGR